MTDAGLVSQNAIVLLRSAARELLPVVIDMGPNQAKFTSFVDAVEEDHGVWAVLEPVAADALPIDLTTPFRIRPAQDSLPWTVSAHCIERVTATRARVELSHARVLPPDREDGAVPVQATDLLVLVVPGGLDGGSAYVFPIQRIGADVCEIRSSVALAPGQALEQVEIVGDRRLLRRASAQVLQTVPWHMSDGTQSFSCRVSLDAPALLDPDRPHDLVTDPREVKRLIEFAGMLSAQGWYEAPGWSRGALRFLQVGRDSMSMELSNDAGRLAPSPRSVRIGFELFAIAYELDVRMLDLHADRLQTSLPLILRRRRRHRRDHRVEVGLSQLVEISFRHPVTGMVERRRLIEVSFFALCFECDVHTHVLWPGLPLEQAQLSWGKRLVHLGDIEVDRLEHEHDGSARCIATIPNSQISDDPEMICLMATLQHPKVRTYEGENFAALHALYLKAGLFGPHMHRNLAPILEQTTEVWHKLHRDASDLIRTFVHGPDDAPDAAVTVVRAWEHAWVSQHFVDTSPEISGASGSLQSAYLDHLVPRADGRYLIFFVKIENHVMNAYLTRFFAGSGTADAVARSVVELWIRPADASEPASIDGDAMLRPSEPEDEIVISRSVEQRLGVYAAAALSIVPGEIHIEGTRSRFERAGLERSRDCHVVTRNHELAYALLEERATPGVNLTWMLNATWIFPVHSELDRDGQAFDRALRDVVDRPAQTATGERFLNLPEGLNHTRLQAWGFRKEASLYLYTLTRAGLHRFHNYAFSRYGEIDALALRRTRRRQRSQQEST